MFLRGAIHFYLPVIWWTQSVFVQSDNLQTPLLPDSSTCVRVCSELARLLPGSVTFEGEPQYTSQQLRYWAQQQSTQRPTCRVTPSSAQEISLVIHNIRKHENPCVFAVKSGGHSTVKDNSNLNGGVTLDLVKISSIDVLEGKTSTWIGSGSRWQEVYKHLDKLDLSVSGGRAGGPGVGGYVLGGGISHFSSKMGWACDGVESFEVILSNGSIIEANREQHSDLFSALKGGGNNFGIISRFRLATFEQRDIFSTIKTYEASRSKSIFDAITLFNIEAPNDPAASATISMAYLGFERLFITVGMVHVTNLTSSPLFEKFEAIPFIGGEARSTRISEMTRTIDESNPSGYRQHKSTFTVLNSAAYLRAVGRIFSDLLGEQNLYTDRAFRPGLYVQPLTVSHLSQGDNTGGNAMSLSVNDGPLILIFLEVRWCDESRDILYTNVVDMFTEKCIRKAKEMGVWHPFIYLNYAAEGQKVFPSYGKDSLEKLRKVRNQYDPERLFTIAQAGPFKLD